MLQELAVNNKRIMSYIILALFLSIFQVTAKCPNHGNCSSEERVESPDTSLTTFPADYWQATNVSHNTISSVKRYSLWNRSAEVIDISNSVIDSIDRLAFMGKDRVREINISWNNIKFIYPETFLFTPKLSRLSLANNRFLSLKNGLMFSGNSLKVLDLSYCNISRIEQTTIKYGVTNLKELYLQHNKITYFSRDSLNSLTNLKIMNIGYNNLHSVDIDMFVSLKSLMELNLENNPIPCHCSLKEIYISFLAQKIKFENMTCEVNSENDHKTDWLIFFESTNCNYRNEMKTVSATKDRDHNDESDAEDSDELSAATIAIIALLVVVAVIVVCACLLSKNQDCLGAIGCALICIECLP